MNLIRAAVGELRTRAQAANDTMEARVLDSLLDVAECTASIAGATNRLHRCDTSSELVAAALRVERQTILNLIPVEHVGAVNRGSRALIKLHDQVAQLMIIVGNGKTPDEAVMDAFNEAERVLTAWTVCPTCTARR